MSHNIINGHNNIIYIIYNFMEYNKLFYENIISYSIV